VPALLSFDYALLRVVPRVEREEFVNAGVLLFCLARVLALNPGADLPAIEEHLRAVPLIAAGGGDGGPIGRLSARERFHWLVAPRSTVLQVSPVHSGLCESPEAELAQLFERMVRLPRTDAGPAR
jgi:hypothetical protein